MMLGVTKAVEVFSTLKPKVVLLALRGALVIFQTQELLGIRFDQNLLEAESG